MQRYLRGADLERHFLEFARTQENLTPDAHWPREKAYMLTQVRALVSRYTKLGDNAYFHVYLDIDECFKHALTAR
ncbi:MAG: hypothetical protein J5871_01270 [Bacteroidales bacterium]|nr:hypothetical protein [Bacteroidales bacterium]